PVNCESLYKDAESSDEDGVGSHPHLNPVAESPSWKENYDWLCENSDEDDGGSPPHPTPVAGSPSWNVNYDWLGENSESSKLLF
ncbi:hypothetical protein AVEN_116400-1, partial [Araneus ventricosus]